ncbi:MAG: NAD-dependent epimerase/dehydratase family protein [Anaerolineales bacterium]
MKIMVTGGAGFIGSHVTDMLIEVGHQVLVVDNLSTGRHSNINPNAIFYEVDIRSPEMDKVFSQEKPEVICHHAAQMDVRRSMEDPLYDADVNIIGSIKLAQLAIQYGTRKFIHISSGGAAYGEPEYLPCDENHPIKPLCHYGASKYTFELYLHVFAANYNLEYSVIRYPNVYGPRQDPNGEAGVVAIFTGQMLRNNQVTINGNGEQMRDYVNVTDCARFNLALLEQGNGQVYNLGSGIGTTVNEIFELLKKITGYSKLAFYGPAKVGETFKIYLNAGRAERELGWRPTISLEEGLQRTVDYFEEVELSPHSD